MSDYLGAAIALAPGAGVDDPVAAYSRLGPHFADISSRRERYLRGIEKCMVSRIAKFSAARRVQAKCEWLILVSALRTVSSMAPNVASQCDDRDCS